MRPECAFRNDEHMIVRLVAAAALSLAAIQNLTGQAPPGQEPGAGTTVFKNFNRTFQIELPSGWRQIAPNEAVKLSENEQSPALLRLAQPSHFYAVGPIAQWLAGDFSGPWLYVVEQRDEWYIEEDFEETVREHWREQGLRTGDHHDVASVHREKLGTQQVECVVATRQSTSKGSDRYQSLDIHAPTGRQQITLSFTCAPEDFAKRSPEFRSWLESLTFARVPEEPATISDRLWTPILVGGVVGLILLLLYRHTRARR